MPEHSVDRASQGVRGRWLEEETWRMGRAGAEWLYSRSINESKGKIPDMWNGLQWGQMFSIEEGAGLERHKALFAKKPHGFLFGVQNIWRSPQELMNHDMER